MTKLVGSYNQDIMSEDNNNDGESELVCSADAYELKVSIELESKDGSKKIAAIDTEATIPFLLMEDHVLLAEPRVRKQLDSLVDSFKLLCASKLNRLIESTKGAENQIVQNSGSHENENQDIPEIDGDEL